MACTKERSEQIGDLAAGKIGSEGAGALLEHLETCPACSAELDLVAALVAAGEERGAALYRDRRAKLAPILRWAPLAAAAALLAVLAVALDPFGAEPAPDPVAALAEVAPLAWSDQVLRAPGAGERPEAWRTAYADAMDLYARGDFSEAVHALGALDPGDSPLVHLYQGICWLQLGELYLARYSLQAAAELGEGLLRERALWYLAQAHLANGNREYAERTLESLVESRGDYEPNAREQLAALRALPVE